MRSEKKKEKEMKRKSAKNQEGPKDVAHLVQVNQLPVFQKVQEMEVTATDVKIR